MTLAERLRHPFSNGYKEPIKEDCKEEDSYYDDLDEKDKEIIALKEQIQRAQNNHTEFLQQIILELINRQPTTSGSRPITPAPVPTSSTSLGSSVAKLPGPVGKLP